MSQHPRAAAIAVTTSATWVLGVYAAMPAALALAARFRPRPLRTDGPMPTTVSVVIAAHDEEAAIGGKLDDLAGQELPAGIDLRIVLASDGSTDATVAIATAHPVGATVLDLDRVGKATAMNLAIAEASGEVVVFTDANSRLGPDAIARLLAPFADPNVGGVAGDQRYTARPSGTAMSERDYWSYERALKTWESAIGNVVSSTGTLHAVRRELVDEVPGDVTDDFWLSTGVIARGRRLVFAADALAWEAPNELAGAEYRRRVRIITRGLTAIRRRRELLDPRRHGAYAVVLVVHKVARRLVFAPMVVTALAAGIAARRSGTWRLLAAGQAAFYAAAAAGLVAPRSRIGRRRAVAAPAHFCLANAAAAHAVVNVLRNRTFVTWSPERG